MSVKQLKALTNTILITLLLLANVVYSQTISILSKSNKSPVLFAHVLIKPISPGAKEYVLLTDTNGTVLVPSELSGARVNIIVSCIGFEKHTDAIVLDKNKIVFLQQQNQVLNEVVITGQYAPNSPEKAVHKIKIIDRKKIDAMGAQNLRDALTNEMNIRISQDNVLGSSM
ncbi:MAG: hypothetical protein IT235_03140, partial [Bacteroidia bacterium]|nr:hypothetical protein [Bacteroidia bacterium]